MTCPPDEIDNLIALMQRDELGGMHQLNEMLLQYPRDPQILFLMGSFLAGKGILPKALELLRLALAMAPDFDMARFQLGLLELTSGAPDRAAEIWAPFQQYPDGNFLRLFADGLAYLVRNQFDRAIELLSRGMEANDIIPQYNADLRAMIMQIRSDLEAATALSAGRTEPRSQILDAIRH